MAQDVSTAGWRLWKLVAVRFVALFLLVNLPFLIGLLPFAGPISKWTIERCEGLIIWFGESWLGFDEVVLRETGSGDGAFEWSRTALSLVVAVLGAILWTALARQRRSEPKLLAWIYVLLRYGLAVAMIQYGLAKVLPSQFPAPQGDMLLFAYGEVSPMGLLWRYMGFSHAFNLLTGGVELIGGLLLFFRRTWLVGALVTAMAMVQVVAINFAFDVPVKIFSSELLAAALVLLLPFRHRLLSALFTNDPVPARRPPVPAVSDRVLAFKNPIKLAALAMCLAFMTHAAWGSYNTWGRGASFEFAGIYDVTSVTPAGGQAETTVVSIDNLGGMSLWHEVGEWSTGQRYWLEPDDDGYTLLFSPPALNPDQFQTSQGRMTLERVGGNRVALAGRIGSRDVSMTLNERPPPELLNRGFHWVSEYPYNR